MSLTLILLNICVLYTVKVVKYQDEMIINDSSSIRKEE